MCRSVILLATMHFATVSYMFRWDPAVHICDSHTHNYINSPEVQHISCLPHPPALVMVTCIISRPRQHTSYTVHSPHLPLLKSCTNPCNTPGPGWRKRHLPHFHSSIQVSRIIDNKGGFPLSSREILPVPAVAFHRIWPTCGRRGEEGRGAFSECNISCIALPVLHVATGDWKGHNTWSLLNLCTINMQ